MLVNCFYYIALLAYYYDAVTKVSPLFGCRSAFIGRLVVCGGSFPAKLAELRQQLEIHNLLLLLLMALCLNRFFLRSTAHKESLAIVAIHP